VRYLEKGKKNREWKNSRRREKNGDYYGYR
jgi:hypothetical protein